jgi:uncharacterized glyoxalase superfamily protein PhnB
MQFKGFIPVIDCTEIEPLLNFYQQAFRYVIINKTETDQGLQWVHLKSDDTYLMLRKRTAQGSDECATDNILLYYYTDDVDAQYRFMQARGFKLSALSETPYGMKEFFLCDPEGNRLGVGERSGAT